MIPYWFVRLRNHSLLGDCAYRPSSRASARDIVPATAATARIPAAVLHRPNHSTSASRSSAGVHATNNRNGCNIVTPKIADSICVQCAATLLASACRVNQPEVLPTSPLRSPARGKTHARHGLCALGAAGRDDAWVLGLKYQSGTSSVAPAGRADIRLAGKTG